MSERPSVILISLLAAASLLSGLLAAALLVLGGGGIASLAGTIAHALAACIFALVESRQIALPSFAALLLTVLSLAAFARTLRTYLAQRGLLRSLPLEPLVDRSGPAPACTAGIDVYVTPAARPTAFCFGLIRPRVVLSSGLLARLDPDERTAVICHEAHHVRTRDPLRCLLARFAASTFFWLPLLTDLLDRYLLVKEIAADRHAVTLTGRRALAGALHEVAGTPTPTVVAGLAEFAAARIDRLFDPGAPLPPLWRRSRLALSVLVVLLIAAAAAVPGHVDAGALDGLGTILLGGAPHGLAGACLDFIFNALLLIAVALTAWRVLTWKGRARTTGQEAPLADVSTRRSTR